MADHHPHLLRLLWLWCKRMGFSYPLWLQRLDRKAPVGESMAEALEREIGTPKRVWLIEPELKPERAGKRARAVHAPAADMPLVALRGQQPVHPEHRLYIALRKRGLSLRQWCSDTGRNRATWSSRLTGRRPTPRDEAESVAREFPGEVSAEDFVLIPRGRRRET